MHAKTSSYSTSSTTAPQSPDAVSAVAPPSSTGKPPISPPQALPGMPTLMRLPSLVTRTNQALHIRQPPAPIHSHARPSVIATPQAQTRLLTTPPVAMPPSPHGSEPPSPRELAARLALLLHARECCTPLDMERVCGVRNCRVARGVLDHCQECFLADAQCHRSCSEAKQLLRHFRVCRAQQFQRACPICDLLRTEFAWAMQHARSLTPLFVPLTSGAPMDTTDHAPYYHYPPAEPQRRHSSYQPEPYLSGAASAAAVSLRRSVSEGPQATMSAAGHHKRSNADASSPAGHVATMEPPLVTPMVKRVRIVTPTEEAEAAARQHAKKA